MSGDTFQFKKQSSLATSDNHQLALFPEGNQPEINIRSSALYQKLWGAQKRKFAAFSSNAKLRSRVASADRCRKDCRNDPVTENYPWEWPEFPRHTHQHSSALQQLLEEISQHIAHALSRPCPVFEDQNAMRVELLDCFAWVALKAERELSTEVKDSSGEWHEGQRVALPGA